MPMFATLVIHIYEINGDSRQLNLVARDDDVSACTPPLGKP